VKFASIRVIRACSKPLRNTIKPLSKAPQTATKKNFQAKKAFIFVHLMNAFWPPPPGCGPFRLCWSFSPTNRNAAWGEHDSEALR